MKGNGENRFVREGLRLLMYNVVRRRLRRIRHLQLLDLIQDFIEAFVDCKPLFQAYAHSMRDVLLQGILQNRQKGSPNNA